MRFLILAVALFSLSAQAQVSTNRKYKDVTDFLHNLAVKYPTTTEVFSLGFSDGGVAIEGVKIGNGPVKNLVVGTHHGNEYGSTELAIGFADALAQAPIPGQTMYVIPVLNIDGYNVRSRYERVNGRQLDLNRDYPGPCGSDGPFNSKSTMALANFIDQNNIVALATIHTFWPAVVYPWGISTHDIETPYTPTFLQMVQAATHLSKYTIGNSTEVVYPADGCFEDYAYWKHGIWSILFEVGRSHNPGVTDLNEMVRTNVPGLRKMFEIAPTARAANHAFEGQCNMALKALDMRIE